MSYASKDCPNCRKSYNADAGPCPCRTATKVIPPPVTTPPAKPVTAKPITLSPRELSGDGD